MLPSLTISSKMYAAVEGDNASSELLLQMHLLFDHSITYLQSGLHIIFLKKSLSVGYSFVSGCECRVLIFMFSLKHFAE